MKLGRIFIFLGFLTWLLPPSSMPAEPPPDKLEELRKQWEEARNQYRDALNEKKNGVEKAIREEEQSLKEQEEEEKRKESLDHIEDLQKEREDLNDKIRVINAGDVVKFSNTKNKVVKILTRQS